MNALYLLRVNAVLQELSCKLIILFEPLYQLRRNAVYGSSSVIKLMRNARGKLTERAYFFLLKLLGSKMPGAFCHVPDQLLDKIRIEPLQFGKMFFVKSKPSHFSYCIRKSRS